MQEKNTRVVNCRKESYDIYIGRPSLWGGYQMDIFLERKNYGN
jgi:hypothetical protein